MSVITATGVGVTTLAAAVAAAEGWGSPAGLGSFGLFLVGAGTLIWSIYQGVKRRNGKHYDASDVADLVEELEHRKRGPDAD